MRRIFLFIALLFFCVNAFSAKMKWEEITEKDWKVANKAGEESHAVIIFDKCWKDDRDNTSFRYYRRMKILDTTGVDAGKVTVGFNASWTNEVRVRGRTLHPDGAVFELQEKDIHTKRVVKSGNVKVNETTFILPRVEPGCIIEYDYKAWGRSTRPLHVWNFQRKYPVSLSVFHWHMNPTTPTRYLLDRIPRDRYRVEKVPEESMYPVELIFTVWDMPPVVDEPFSHPESELTATGYFYYVSTVETAEDLEDPVSINLPGVLELKLTSLSGKGLICLGYRQFLSELGINYLGRTQSTYANNSFDFKIVSGGMRLSAGYVNMVDPGPSQMYYFSAGMSFSLGKNWECDQLLVALPLQVFKTTVNYRY